MTADAQRERHVPEFSSAAVAVVGGTGAVGREIARQFLAAGVTRIALVGRDPERAESARAGLSDEFPAALVVAVCGNVNAPDDAARVIDEVAQHLGGLDILVNSTATAYVPRLLHQTDPEVLPEVIVGQLFGPMNTSRAALPRLRSQNGGVIVNIATDAAKYPTPGEAAIGAAAAGIVMFSRTLAAEGKRDGIRVNVVTPSIIADSGGWERVMDDEFSGKLFRKAIGAAMLGVAEPSDIAALVVFLSGPSARRITGQVISPNGGIST